MSRRVGDAVWNGLVPIACVLAGLLFATSRETAQGTDLRAGRRLELAQLSAEAERKVTQYSGQVTRLEGEVKRLEDAAAGSDRRVANEQGTAAALEAPVGLTPVHGPGLTVTLRDAPTRPDGTLPPNARNVDDIVVHQQDVQAVVNALWAGGAEAMTIQGQRIIATGAVKCVGNTLLLYGHTYSPPFRITAVGDQNRQRRALDQSPGVQEYLRAVDYFGVGYSVNDERDVTLPGYDGPLRLSYAEPVPDTGSN